MTTVSSASCIISAWTNILYCLLGAQCLWIPPEIERALLSPVFKAFSDTHVVLDCTEIFCQTQSSMLVLNEVTNITLYFRPLLAWQPTVLLPLRLDCLQALCMIAWS